MPDQEIDAIRAAYECIKGMDRKQWTRALEYLSTRMAEDDRGAYVHNVDTFAPTSFVLTGDFQDHFETAEEAIECEDSWTPIEVNGVAVVSQRFAVIVKTEDAHETEWFESRDAAQTFIDQMLSMEARDSTDV